MKHKIGMTNDIANFIPTDELIDGAEAYTKGEDRAKIEKSQLVQYMRAKGHERIQRRIGKDRIRGYAKINIVAFRDENLPF